MCIGFFGGRRVHQIGISALAASIGMPPIALALRSIVDATCEKLYFYSCGSDPLQNH